MAKTKKGRKTSSTKSTQRVKSTRLAVLAERLRQQRAEINEIDVTTLADDDPSRKRVARATAYAVLEVDSDEEDIMIEPKDDTPRKGEDKKRQRFATETEIIELEQEDNISSDGRDYQKPMRLMDRMDSESETSDQPASIADVLGEGPEESIELPEPLIIAKDCRYTCQVKVPPKDHPAQYVSEKFVGFITWLQNKIGKDLSTGTWDDAADKHRVYSKVQQLPKHTDSTAWTAIWGTWINLKPHQEGTAFLKVRFITKSPDTLSKRLFEIGELRDEASAETDVYIGQLPIACQAVQVGCVGWLFGSNKHMHSSDLLQEVIRLANIPPHVRMGISWRAIKLENGRTPQWIDNMQPASALHVDMDTFHAPVYKPTLARLFKKHGTLKPLGVSMRLIPCFSADEGKNATKDQRMSAVEMREKQEFLVKEHITLIKTPYILNLDKPTKPNGSMTLRRYLKNLHPQGLVAARLILSVDKAWQEGSKETNIVTTREYASQVQDALRDMIPECVHRYGKGTQGWFTREGLLAFQGVEWDPLNKKSVSDRDVEAIRMVAEDYFGMGDAWRKKRNDHQRPSPSSGNTIGITTPGTPAASIPQAGGKKTATIDTLLAQTINKSTDAASFGDLYQRPHDGDTARTSHRTGADDVSLSSHESDSMQDGVTFADVPAIPNRGTENNGDASTAKSSTHYRLQRDHCRAMAEKSQEESRQLLETLKREREEFMKTREELEKLRVSNSTSQMVTPSANRGRTGAAADGTDAPD